MSIKVLPHEERFRSAVEAFNQRMQSGGSEWGFYPDPKPDWIPYQEGATTWREYHLAVENEGNVRGAYALKPQDWYINNDVVRAADWQGPFTEAAINPKYSLLMIRLARSAQAQYANLYSLGHADKDVESLKKLGWKTLHLPFSFLVFKPYRFLRFNGYLRKNNLPRLVCDVLAFTGVGVLLWYVWRLKSALPRLLTRFGNDAEIVEQFGTWADDLWQENKQEYAALAIRDAQTMNRLLPGHGWPGGTRLRVTRDGKTIGWSVVLIKAMDSDPRFGSLRVGLIADCFGHPDDAEEVLAATHEHLQQRNVDFACTNFSHPAWLAGLKKIGFVHLPARRTFAFSSPFAEIMEPLDKTGQGLHLTNLDGHGPHGFTDL